MLSIGIDVGTTNTKVAVVDEDGTLVGSANRAVPARRDGDVAEQDAEALWEAVLDAAAEAVTAVGGEIAAVGVCSQYSSIVPVAADATPVADLVLWTDKRGTDHSWAILGDHDDAFMTWLDVHGIPPVGGGLSLAHILHIQRDRPEVHERTAAYLEPMDYVTARLTGRITATQATMFMAQVCDNRSLGATEYHPGLLEMAGVDPTRLPPLVPFEEAVGTLRPDVAERIGVDPGAVVYAGINDSHADVVATGALAAGRGGLSIGTTTVLVDTVDHHGVDVDHEVLAMPCPFGDTYLVWAENGIGGRALEHVLDRMIFATDVLGDQSSADPFASLDQCLATTPAGAGGVLFFPWLNGSLSPDANGAMRGGFLNLSLDTDRTHLVRAVAEGVAHNLRWLVPYAEGFSGHGIEDLVFVGGAARSPAWCQIVADVLDRPVHPAADPDRAVARAAGLLALHRHGALSADDLLGRVETTRTHEPDPATRAVHDAAHEQYLAAFPALRPIYEALNGES